MAYTEQRQDSRSSSHVNEGIETFFFHNNKLMLLVVLYSFYARQRRGLLKFQYLFWVFKYINLLLTLSPNTKCQILPKIHKFKI